MEPEVTLLPPTARSKLSHRKWLSISLQATREGDRARKEARKHLPIPKSRLK
jgi:hypothetical protein